MSNSLRFMRALLKRQLKTPGFSLAVIALLALGIGANTATLNLIYGYLLAPLPYPQANDLAAVYFTAKGLSTDSSMSYRTYFDLRAATKGMTDAGMFKLKSMNVAAGARLGHVRGAVVSASLFTTLGVKPLIGRVFGRSADRPGGVPEVVLSYRTWSRLFDRNRGVLGRVVQIDRRAYTVIGVMPRTFRFPNSSTDLWVPKIFSAFDYSADNMTAWHDRMIARLANGVSPSRLASEFDGVVRRELAAFPRATARHQLGALGLRIAVKPLRASLLGTLGERLMLVQIATAVFLLLVWFNLANLFVARALARRGELITRRVLGADSSVLFRQLFLDSLILSLAGCAGGLILGELLLRVMLHSGFSSTAVSVPLRDWALATAIAVGLAVLSALVFSLAGLQFIRRQDLALAMRETDLHSIGGRSEHRFRKVLVATQLALAFVLCGIGAILALSLLRLDAAKLGFRAQHLLTFQVQVPQGRGPNWTAELRSSLTRIRAAIVQVPGVQEATLASTIPFAGRTMEFSAYANPFVGTQYAQVLPVVAGTGYFHTLGIHLRAGRVFAVTDQHTQPGVAVIDTTAARELFGTTAAVGRRFNFDAPNDAQRNVAFRVIGVVGDTRFARLGADSRRGVVYLDSGQVLRGDHTRWSWAFPTWFVVVRTPMQYTSMLPALSRAVGKAVPDTPIYSARTMEQRLAHRLARRRAVADLVVMFAVGALAVAGIGLYSMLSYTVGQRRAEFGLRAALGADSARLRRLVVQEIIRLLLVGIMIGLICIIVLGKMLAATFYGVRMTDPWAFVLVVVVLGTVTLVAGWLPALTAGRASPLEALRGR